MISNLRASGQNTSKETQDNTHLHLLLFPGIRKDAGKGNPLPDRRAFCCFEVPFNWTTCTEVLLLWAPKRTRGPEMRGSALPFWSGNAFIHRAFIQTHTFACNVRDPWTTLTYPERCGKFMDLSWLKNFESGTRDGLLSKRSFCFVSGMRNGGQRGEGSFCVPSPGTESQRFRLTLALIF